MHTLIIQKSGGVILQSRYDNSTGTKMEAAEVLSTFVSDNNIDAATVEIVEIPFTKFTLTVGKNIYNKVNGQIEDNPLWIEPPAVETQSIPVSDPGAAQ